MITRRRLLSISAAAFASRGAYATSTGPVAKWQGRALGADASITLSGVEPRQARHIFHRVEQDLTAIENRFSLYRQSDLVRLNRHGRLAHPPADFLALLRTADRVHSATGGVFDPSIQPLWSALATGGDVTGAARAIGWQRVAFNEAEIRLDAGMALTLNGIAQGWAADRIAGTLANHGLSNVLVDMGEIAARGERPAGGPWRAEIVFPDGKSATTVHVEDRALATSAPGATRLLNGTSHILHPAGRAPQWNLVSVMAPDAALADALSTAFCVMTRAEIDHALAITPEAELAFLG